MKKIQKTLFGEKCPCFLWTLHGFSFPIVGVFAEDFNNNIMFTHWLLNCFTLSTCIKRVSIISNLWLKDDIAGTIFDTDNVITSKFFHRVSLFVKGPMCFKMSIKYIWRASDQFQCPIVTALALVVSENVNARSRDRRGESEAIVEEKWRKGKGRANGKVGRLMEGKLKGEGGNMQFRLGSGEGGGI